MRRTGFSFILFCSAKFMENSIDISFSSMFYIDCTGYFKDFLSKSENICSHLNLITCGMIALLTNFVICKKDIYYLINKCLSSHRRFSVKKGVLKNFAKFTGKHLCQSLFFNKVAGVRPATLLKKRLRHRGFSVNFANFLRTPFLLNTSRQLLL